MIETANPAPTRPCPRWCGLLVAVCLVFAFASSYYSWTHNSHELQLRKRYPGWFRGHYALFDGYGTYTEQIRNLIRSPERFGEAFRAYATKYHHTNTPLYPLLCALLTFAGLNTVWSCFTVNAAASLLCVFLFYRLIRQRSSVFGRPELLTFLTFLLHCSVLSGLARPLPDMMCLAVLLAFFLACRHYQETQQRRRLVAVAVLCVVGALTKTVLYLLAPVFVIVLVKGVMTGSRWSTRRRVLISGAFGVVAVAVMVGVLVVLRDTASIRFVLNISRNAFGAWFSSRNLPGVIEGGLAFFALSFGLYPLILAGGWSRQLAREEMEHVVWLALYAGQRILFAGFNLGYGRARYGIPLVASLAILCLPGYRRLCASERWRWFAPVPILLQVAVWCYFLYRLTGVPRGVVVNINLPG